MIRQALAGDIPAILDLAVASELFPADATEELASILVATMDGQQGPDHLWLTAEDRFPIGVAYVAPERMTEGTWNLLMIAIHPDHQRKGIGAALVRHVEGEVQKRGARILLVETSGLGGFERTRAFYRSLNYEQEARIRDYYKDGDDKIVFRKKFT